VFSRFRGRAPGAISVGKLPVSQGYFFAANLDNPGDCAGEKSGRKTAPAGIRMHAPTNLAYGLHFVVVDYGMLYVLLRIGQ